MRRFWPGLLLVAVGGAVSVPGFAPLGFSPLALLGVALLAGALDRAVSVRHALALGGVWGLVFFVCGVGWLYVALHRYGGMSAPLAALAVVLFCAYLALFPLLAAGLFQYLKPRGVWAKAALFAGLWTVSELLRGGLFTGFPWLALGYAQTPPSPLSGYFPLFGVYGVSLISVWLAAVLALTVWRQRRTAALALCGVAALLLLGQAAHSFSWTLPQGEPVRVALIQPNIEQGLKWDRRLARHWLDLNLELLRSTDATLRVLPETTVPTMVDDLPSGYLDTLKNLGLETGSDIVLGVFLYGEQGSIHNAALSRGVSPTQWYAKRHLVPFGEYSPPMFGWVFHLVNIPMSSQRPGRHDQAPLQLQRVAVGVNICYEDAFGRELLDMLPQAQILLNLSNLAWYGNSWAQPQHLQIAQVRAMETGRPMLRSTNTGMTAVVLPDGKVSGVLPPFTRGVLEAEVQPYGGLTPYARWGDWGAALMALVALMPALRQRLQQRRQYVAWMRD